MSRGRGRGGAGGARAGAGAGRGGGRGGGGLRIGGTEIPWDPDLGQLDKPKPTALFPVSLLRAILPTTNPQRGNRESHKIAPNRLRM